MGRDGSRGGAREPADPGVPGVHPEDVLPAAHPDPFLPGCGAAVLGAADNQLRREPALPELQAGLQRALPGTGAEAACVPGCPGPAQLPHLRPSAGGRPGNVPGTPARPEVGRASRQRN